MKTESASADHFAGLQEIADTITRLREDRAELLVTLKELGLRFGALVLASGDFSDVNARAIDTTNAVIEKIEGGL